MGTATAAPHYFEKRERMAKVAVGILCGLVFGGIAVATRRRYV